MDVTRVCICHRTRLFGECLERSLSVCDTFKCRSLEPAQAIQTAAEWPADPFDLLLLDAALSNGEIAVVVTALRQHLPLCKMLLLVPVSATDRIVGLTQLGSHGCIAENGSLHDLCIAIRTVLGDKPYFSADLANMLFLQLKGCRQGQDWGSYVDSPGLTAREQEVLRLIAWEQLSNKQIAKRLHVSLYTVKNHVHNMIEKLGVNDRHGAAQLAQRRNLIASVSSS